MSECRPILRGLPRRHGAYEGIGASAGKWTLGAYDHPIGSAESFLGSPVTITARSPHTVTANLTIAYQGL